MASFGPGRRSYAFAKASAAQALFCNPQRSVLRLRLQKSCGLPSSPEGFAATRVLNQNLQFLDGHNSEIF